MTWIINVTPFCYVPIQSDQQLSVLLEPKVRFANFTPVDMICVSQAWSREGIQIPRMVFKINVYYDTVASTATVVGTLYLREIHVCFYLVIGH